MRSSPIRLSLSCAAALLVAVGCDAGRSHDGIVTATPVARSSPESGPIEHWPSPSPIIETPASATPRNRPGFDASIAPVRGTLLREVRHKNWHPGCPVPLRDLRVLTVDYHGFDGNVRSGPLVLNEGVVDDVLGVFRRLYRADFPIKHIALARKYKPHAHRYDDRRDVTASFNCRPATGNRGSLSQHSYGWAIDINPIQNPYIGSNGKVLQRAAKAYVDRSQQLPGMIHPGDVVVRAFTKIGWGWGGDWHSLKDYMHFSLTGT
jgi:hypothetical protein